MASNTKPSPPDDEDYREKTRIGMMRIGRFAGIALMFIAVARYVLLKQAQGKTVIDATTIGTFGLGLITFAIVSFLPPIPPPFVPKSEVEAAPKKKKKLE